MKRHVEVNPYDVSKHRSIFAWHKCWFCEQEFRRESGFQWFYGNSWCYSCATCCISISHCNDKIKHARETTLAKIAGSRPPAPPMRSYNNALR